MRCSLCYGEGSISFAFPEGAVPLVLTPNELPPLPDPLVQAEKAVAQPMGTPPLLQMLVERKPRNIVIVVNDITRPTPYNIMLPPILDVFRRAGIADSQVTLLVATGIHAPHTQAQNLEVYGEEFVRRLRIVSHDAYDAESLTSMGALSSGYEFHVNSLVAAADFVITLGVVTPHYFAGFSGGRKSILPGLAGKDTVASNHARMVEIMDDLPPIDDNPVSREMVEAARRVGVDFIMNVVVNGRGELAALVAGDLEVAWRSAVDVSARLFEAPFASQVDVCVVCAGGRPRDINAYQAQKALDHADRLTRPGGTIVLAAECPEGFGEEVFEEWLSRGWPPEKVMAEIKRNFVMGGHKAYGFAKVASRKDVFLVSALSEADSNRLYASKFGSVQDAVDAAAKKHGASASWAFMPDGGITLPVPKA